MNGLNYLKTPYSHNGRRVPPDFEYQHRRFKDRAIALSMPGERRLENLK